jgi:signal transduction histidine kinase
MSVEKAAIPENEAKRLVALRDLDILDTPPEAIFDDIARIASTVCGCPIAMVSLVDADRQWFKATVGIEPGETPRDVAFCAHAILDDEIFVVQDATKDRRFHDNPFVIGAPEIRFYAGAPLSLPSGDRVGTLCILDSVPRALTPPMREALLALKRQAEANLALRARGIDLKRANERLLTLQTQKEQLVQFVVHDMKNALTSLSVGAEMMVDASDPSSPHHEMAREMVSAVGHLARMTNDMLDIAGAEQGSPLRAQAKTVRVGEIFDQIAGTFAAVLQEADQTLVRIGADVALRGDPYLLRRVLENIVSNGVRLAPRSSTLRLEAERHGDVVRVVVADEGPGVAESMREAIFELYGTFAGERANYGIGLAFSRAAMSAQKGRIWAEPHRPRGTCFVIELPAA